MLSAHTDSGHPVSQCELNEVRMRDQLKAVTVVVVAKLCRQFAAKLWKTLSYDLRPVRRHGPNGVRPSGQVLNVS
jgi:hypothetical protein